ncbi:hypothetical protein FRC08_003417 [Ceratobasidium sp. 394]|nr:hypothetical protein FRC08_003417 [Ceratobasidium sp. 394]
MRMTLIPPVLPPFLASTYDLKPVEGVPGDEEVKMVHAVIRALNDVVNVPVLYDADLAMRLSMHLFSIQMARYRDKHPCIIFPSRVTHTPPPLPTHIPVELELVTGSPSNEQIKSVQTALRLSENLANVPSMFDADLSMKLSQHLFDIQFERYLHQVADEDRSAPVATSRVEEMNSNHSDRGNSDAGSDVSVDVPPPVIQSSTATRLTVEQTECVLSEPQPNPTELLKIGLEDTKQLLVGIGSTLENVNRVLIRTQQGMAKGFNAMSGCHHNRALCSHVLLNAKGEDPRHLGVPSISGIQYSLYYGYGVQDSDIVRYLRFYGIGAKFIEEGDEPRIREGKIDAAKAELRSYLGV